MGSPIPSSSDNFWINPCGIEFIDEEDSSESMPVDGIFEAILINSKVSHQQAEMLKKHMLENFISLDEDSLTEQYYDWLQSPPADLEHFSNVDREDAIKEAFYLMQKFAVALDQMNRDQDDKPEYHELLIVNKNGIVQLLCSLQMSLMSLHVQPHPDATMDVMSDELRTLGEAGKLLRDFLVVRDYVKATYYIKELIEYYRDRN